MIDEINWEHVTNDFQSGLYKTRLEHGWLYCLANKPKWWKFWAHSNFALCYVPDVENSEGG